MGSADVGSPSPGTVQRECGAQKQPVGLVGVSPHGLASEGASRVCVAEGSTPAAGLAWVCMASGNLIHIWLDRHSRAER